MPEGTQAPAERVFEERMGNLLRAGVLAAAAVVFAGALVYLLRHGFTSPDYGAFHGEPADLRTISGIVRRALTFSGQGLIQFGLLLLIATPVARVVFALLGFWQQRDRTYIVVSSIVLAILLYSLTRQGF